MSNHKFHGRKVVEISKLECDECGFVMFVPRKPGQFRKQGHNKHMYCPKCKKCTLHIESYDRW